MADENTGGIGSFLANPSALLALITLAGGLWLASNKLTSERPVTPAGGAKGFLADQNVEARLWEDPFKANDGTATNRAKGSLTTLQEQIDRRVRVAAGPGHVVLLPVMIPGGQYSEDKESRIRSRFAIISALGRAGYVPDDAEHIGTALLGWPSQAQLSHALRAQPAKWGSWLTDLLAKEKTLSRLKPPAEDSVATMEVRYEWYRQRTFAAGSAAQVDAAKAVLVLWLDDAYFEDEPRLRLALFFEPLVERIPFTADASLPSVRLIGPRRSSTLRHLLPEWEERDRLAKLPQPQIAATARKVLDRIAVYSATVSAMDHVLVQNPGDTKTAPRVEVAEQIRQQGFTAFHNFAATDEQLAREVYRELALRGANFSDPKHHVALLSEWDTFYGRMLTLTYAATMPAPKGTRRDLGAFINDVRKARPWEDPFPANFHSFVYLRGLDGQTIGPDSGNGAEDSPPKRGARLASLDEMNHWMPDINKAEGQAQFDYLGRLGDQLENRQRSLRLAGEGQIKAIGIVGSDVYDTLLILQALRPRFPNVLFFTTDLDVRFLHPHERDWARNLIVVSSYGLELHKQLQGAVPPFRDSMQTAQFAATLAAFGVGGLDKMTKIEPRRFEVGNNVAVDLSQKAQSTALKLHPEVTSELPHKISGRVVAGLAATMLVIFGTSLLWSPLRRFTWEAWSHPASALEFSEEDIGGPDGAEALLQRVDTLAGNPLAEWLASDSAIANVKTALGLTPRRPAKASNWKREDLLAEATRLIVARLNQGLTPHHVAAQAPEKIAPRTWSLWRPPQDVVTKEKLRRHLNMLLAKLEQTPPAPPAAEPPSADVQLVDAVRDSAPHAVATATTPGVAIKSNSVNATRHDNDREDH